MNSTKNPDKVIEECLKILKSESSEQTQKWIADSKITSLNLRNTKAL